jgi:class 3 adenylate cyclase
MGKKSQYFLPAIGLGWEYQTGRIKMERVQRAKPVPSHLRNLGRTRAQCVREELLSNSMHFPAANLLYEFFLIHGDKVFGTFETYALLSAALIQALVLGSWRYQGRPHYLVGNLIGPAVYLGFECFHDGIAELGSVNHMLYVLFALTIGMLQQAQHEYRRVERYLLVMEATVRTTIILALYTLFEVHLAVGAVDVKSFFADSSHRFITASLLLLGVLLGFAHVGARRYLEVLTLTAQRLREISVWSWGHNLVSDAVLDPNTLRCKRVNRFVLFLDIRGFTKWSEQRHPEQVLTLLNLTFDALESEWATYPVIRAKYTGDELMLVLDGDADINRLCRKLLRASEYVLGSEGLGVGVGVNYGPVVEGLMGSRSIRGYDFLGDTVNVASRLCSAAAAGEFLISETASAQANSMESYPERSINAKGKRLPIVARVGCIL